MIKGWGTYSTFQPFLFILPNVPCTYYVHRYIWTQLCSVWYLHVPHVPRSVRVRACTIEKKSTKKRQFRGTPSRSQPAFACLPALRSTQKHGLNIQQCRAIVIIIFKYFGRPSSSN